MPTHKPRFKKPQKWNKTMKNIILPGFALLGVLYFQTILALPEYCDQMEARGFETPVECKGHNGAIK
jgi:hypothetical protein